MGDLLLDVSAGTVTRDDTLILLPKLSFELLVALVRAAPGIMSHDRLLEEVWGPVVVNEETLKQRVKLLREVLGDDSVSPRYVAAVRGRGYRIVADVRRLPHDTPNPPDERTRRLRWLVVAGAASALVVTLLFAREFLSPPRSLGPFQHPPRLAVLPIDDLATDQNSAPGFVDGLHDELITRLSLLPELRVISRTSMLPYRTTSKSIPQIAQELSADILLEGSVRRSGERIRMTMQLIDARTDQHVWIQQYERELSVGDLLVIQTDIAQRVADALSLVISGETQRKLATVPTTSLAAYDAYMTGHVRLARQTYGDLLVAVQQFERAVELDRDFADAWAALGWSYTWMGTGIGPWPPDRAYAEAKRASHRALALEPQHLSARWNIATIEYWYRYDASDFEQTLRALIAERPDYVWLRNGLAYYLSSVGRHEEAKSVIDSLVAANPQDPFVLREAAWRGLEARDPDRAEAYLLRALECDQALDGVEILRAGIAILRGDLEQAARVGRGGTRVWALAKLGRFEEARAHMQDYYRGYEDEGVYITPTGPAVALVGLGHLDAAFEWLERGFREHAREMLFLGSIPEFAELHADPRFQGLVDRIDSTRSGSAR